MKTIIFNFLNDFKRNYKTLILAFIIAFGFWLVVSILVLPTIEDRINGILIETQPTDFMVRNNLQIIGNIEDTVNIKIEGKRYDISDLKSTDFYANVDLSSIRSAGSYTLPLEVMSKNPDRDCTITEAEPRMITLTIDEIITKEFDIEATAPNISLPEGFYADDVVASPEKISITGSASVLSSITRIEARSTFHGEISEATRTNSEIFVYGANGVKIPTDSLQLSPDAVSVNIPIYKQKELPLTISIINYPSNFNIDSLKYEIQPKSIIVAAPDETIDNLSEFNIGTIDITEIQLNKNTFIPIALPEGYKNISGNNSARIEWSIDDYDKRSFRITLDKDNIINRPDNFNVTLLTNEINLTAIGPSESLSALTSSDFTVTVNLLGVTMRVGSQDVTASVQIKGSEQDCWVSGTYRVTIGASAITE